MAGGAVALNPAASSSGRMTPILFLVSVTAAFGGLMFGYEIGIAGGAINMDPFVQKFFPNIAVKRASAHSSKYCRFDDEQYQLVISCLFLTGSFVSLLASSVQRMVGRKYCMLASSVFFLCGTAMLAFAQNLATVVFGRVFWGICMGLANSSVPLYLSEMAPMNLRGTLNILFQLATTIGIWAAALINWALVDVYNTPDNAWRIAFGCSVVPGAMMFVGSLLLPNTPASLIELGNVNEARRVLQRIRGDDADVSAEFQGMLADHERVIKTTTSQWAQLKVLGTKPYLPSLFVVLAMPFLQQFTGINSIEFYSNQLFETVGIRNQFRQTMILQSVNCLTTFVAIFLVDRIGRKMLLNEGAIQMALSLIATAILVGTDKSATDETAANFTIVFMCLFVAGFAWSWGPIAWLVPTEIVPLEVRAAGMSLATFSNFLFTFIIGQWFTTMMCHMEYGVYIFFAFFCLVAFVFTVFLLPETRGVKLEDVIPMLQQHSVWRRCYSEKTLSNGGELELGVAPTPTTMSPLAMSPITPSCAPANSPATPSRRHLGAGAEE